MCSEEIPEEILELYISRILESGNVTEICALYKISKFILIFESKTAKEKLENTEILNRFGDYKLTLTAIRSSQKWEGAYYCYTLSSYCYTLSSWIRKWPGSRLAFSNFGEVVSVFKGRRKFNRNIRKGIQGNPVMLPRKIIFHNSITRSVLFAKKVVLCYRCNSQYMLGESCPYS